MRAVICRQLNGIEGLELQSAARPEVGAGQVLIRVRAAGVNFADLLAIKGQYQEKPPLPFTPGMELAGQIESCGPGVAGFMPGQRVMAVIDHGAFAEEAAVPASAVVPLPDAVDYTTAAALAIAYGTAYGALCWAARLAPGATMVVHGAAGGVGLAAVECGRVLGATVIATARGADRLAVAIEHGASHGIDTAAGDVREQIRNLTQGRGADVIFDPVGGDLFDLSLRSLAWGGTLLVIGFASGRIPQIPANLLLVKNISVTGFYWGSYRRHDPVKVRNGFSSLLGWQAEGRIRPHVSLKLPLEHFGEALHALEQRQSTGKVVLLMD